MANGNIANSKADFHEEGIKAKPEDLTAIAKTFEATAVIPSGYLTFFQSVVDLLSKCQKAYKDENFGRMRQYVIAVNEAVLGYLKSHGLSSESLTDSFVDEFLKQLEDKFSKKKYVERKAVEEDTIEKEVEDFKTRVLGKIAQLTREKKTLEKQLKKTSPGADSKSGQSAAAIFSGAKDRLVGDAFTAAVNVTNRALEVREAAFKKNLEKFQVQLGKNVIFNFKNVISKLTTDNLKTFQKNIDRLDAGYRKTFITVLNRSRKQAESEINRGVRSFLNISGKRILNFTLKTLDISLRVFFSIGTVVKIATFWAGKLLSAVGKVLKFAVGLALLPLKLLSFTIKTVYNIASFGVKTVKRFVASTFSLAKSIFMKVSNISIVKFIGKALAAFIMSYPGAYFLGYAMGTIWRMVLKTAGVSNAEITAGTYSIKDDILEPFVENIRNKCDIYENKFKTFFGKSESHGKAFEEKIKKYIEGTRFYKALNSIKDKNWKETFGNLVDTFHQIQDIFTLYLNPILSTLWTFISIFLPEELLDLSTVKMFGRARFGAMVGVRAASRALKAGKWLKNLPRAAKLAKGVLKIGGIIGIVAGIATLGAAAVLGTFDNDEEDKDKLKVKSKYRRLYDGEYKTPAEEAKTTLGQFFDSIQKQKGSPEKEENIRKFRVLEQTYLDLLEERGNLADYAETLDRFRTFYDGLENKGGRLSLIGTEIADKIIYYNGKSVLEQPFSDFKTIPMQLAVLSQVLSARFDDVNAKINEINAVAESENESNISGVLDKVKDKKLYLPKFMTANISLDDRSISGSLVNVNLDMTHSSHYGEDVSDTAVQQSMDQESALLKAMEAGKNITISLGSLGRQQNFSKEETITATDAKYKEMVGQIRENLIEKKEQDTVSGLKNVMFSEQAKKFFFFLKEKHPEYEVALKFKAIDPLLDSNGNRQFIEKERMLRVKDMKFVVSGLANATDVRDLDYLISSAASNDQILSEFLEYIADDKTLKNKNFRTLLDKASRFRKRRDVIAEASNVDQKTIAFISFLNQLLELFCEKFIQDFSLLPSVQALNEQVRTSVVGGLRNGLTEEARKLLAAKLDANNLRETLKNEFDTPEKVMDSVFGVFDTALKKVFTDFMNRQDKDNLKNVIEETQVMLNDPLFKEKRISAAKDFLKDKRDWEKTVREITVILDDNIDKKIDDVKKKDAY